MLSIKKLNQKRARKEVKRAAKRRKLFLTSCNILSQKKAKVLKSQALIVILKDKNLLEQYIAHRKEVKAKRLERKIAKYGSIDNTVV
jgi:hypothetical protein